MKNTSPAPRYPAKVLVLLLLLVGFPAAGDDTDLLRFDTAKPYVFIVLDTSTSMNLDINDNWVHANGDDPRSKIYLAKEVLYDVLSSRTGVHYGFVTFNQDQLRVTAKHWLYFVEDSAANDTELAKLPFAYPLKEPNDQIEISQFDAEGQPDGVEVDIDGDLLTFGPAFVDGSGTAIAGGTCEDPLNLATEREKINRFAKLGATSTETTYLWIKEKNGGKIHRYTFENPSAADKLGKDSLSLRVTVQELNSGTSACNGPSFKGGLDQANLKLKLYREFVMWDDSTDAVHLVPEQTQSKNLETTGGHWDFRDIQGDFRCGPDKPFSGNGWEGNYDTGDPSPPDSVVDNPPFGATDVDTFCPGADSTCTNLLKTATVRDSDAMLATYRELDRGDMLPFHWSNDNKVSFLERLNPKHSEGGRNFGIASYFGETPVTVNSLDQLPLVTADQYPIVAAGNSPLSDVIVDFRCWYTGTSDNKCRNDDLIFTQGFQTLAAANDNEWTCRRPYLLFITDGENNCSGENPTADVSNLFGDAEIRSWVINLGTSNQGAINSIVNPGKGEVVTVETRDDLKDELNRIIGFIEEESRSFASAAVPTVQADVADKIYISQFTPLNERSVWDGHIFAFLKPLPIDPATNSPDLTKAEWDVGSVMVRGDNPTNPIGSGQSPNLGNFNEGANPAENATLGAPTAPLDRGDLKVGATISSRRVYFPMAVVGSEVPRRRQLMAPPLAADLPSGVTANDFNEDLILGLGISTDPSIDLGTDSAADLFVNNGEFQKLHSFYKNFYRIKYATIEKPDGSEANLFYRVGDVFHSNPQIIGGPTNIRFFADNLFDYRTYSAQNARRRKVLLVGSNDGMLHGFDAGVFRTDDPQRPAGFFGNGTGREVFAVIPRSVLPTVRTLADDNVHQWGVDGTPTVADIYMDPQHMGTPSADDREWRTVAVTGLRRGGKGYFAIDMTTPDLMVEDTDETNEVIGYVPVLDGASNGAIPTQQATYPSILWEFSDTSDEEDNGTAVPGNGKPDLGETWSNANIGAIKVLENGDEVVKFVAIFGGGRDPDGLLAGGSGNWLYMVDIETGQTLYKWELEGSAPAEPAAADGDQDGYIDRVYIGTTAGYLYRINTEYIAPLVDVNGQPRVIANQWRPIKIFDTVTTDSAGVETRRPIYFPPSVIFSANLGTYALAFGTGNREDLWSDEVDNRFYLFADDSPILPSSMLPMTEANFTALGSGNTDADLLQGSSLYGSRGWYLELDEGADERVVTPSDAISGIIVFSTFLPEIDDSTSDPDNADLKLCEKSGNSRNYVVFATNGNGAYTDDQGNPSRYDTVTNSFVTEPYVEQGQTRNYSSDAEDPLDSRLSAVMESIKELLPKDCRFNDSYRFDIKTVRSDTGVVKIAPLPVCIRETNWKEF